LQLTGGVAALTLLQTAAAAAAIGYVVTGLHRLGVPRVPLVLAAVVLVALPPVGGFFLCVWKDVPFTIALIFVLGTVARLIRAGRDSAPGRDGHPDPALDVDGGPARDGDRAPAQDGDPTRDGDGGPARDGRRRRYPWRLFALLAVEMLGACLFRQNGIVVTAIVVALCALLLPGARLRMIAAGAAAGATAMLATVFVFPAVGVHNTVSEVAFGSFFSYSDIAVAYLHDPDSFTPADRAVMTKVASLDHWRAGADCYDGDPLVFAPEWDREAAFAHQSELIGLWWAVFRRDPADVVSTHVCRGALAWNPVSTGNLRRNPAPWSVRTYVQRDPRIQQSPFRAAATSDPLSERANKLALRLSATANEPRLEWLLWRGATWSYVGYLVVAVAAWRRRDRTLLALATVTAGAQFSVFVFGAAQAARYMAVPFVLGVILLPVAIIRKSAPDLTGPATVPGAGPAAEAVSAPAADTAGPPVDSPPTPPIPAQREPREDRADADRDR
jgi:hypothetical protein